MPLCRVGDGHITASWYPTIDVDVERYAIEQEIKQLDEINAKLSAILSSSCTNSTPPPSMPGE